MCLWLRKWTVCFFPKKCAAFLWLIVPLPRRKWPFTLEISWKSWAKRCAYPWRARIYTRVGHWRMGSLIPSAISLSDPWIPPSPPMYEQILDALAPLVILYFLYSFYFRELNSSVTCTKSWRIEISKKKSTWTNSHAISLPFSRTKNRNFLYRATSFCLFASWFVLTWLPLHCSPGMTTTTAVAGPVSTVLLLWGYCLCQGVEVPWQRGVQGLRVCGLSNRGGSKKCRHGMHCLSHPSSESECGVQSFFCRRSSAVVDFKKRKYSSMQQQQKK